MGVFDYYLHAQLKVGDRTLAEYNIGDKVDIPDGVYLSHEGLVVISEGVFIALLKDLYSKIGIPISYNGWGVVEEKEDNALEDNE